MDAETALPTPTCSTRVPSSSGTENSAKAFSFLNTRSDFLTVAAVAALLATPSAALGDSVSAASVAALPTRGGDVVEGPGGSILFPRVGRSGPGRGFPGRPGFCPAHGLPAGR